MRIGVDACCWSNRRGYGRFTRELLRALLRNDAENEYWFFADRTTAGSYIFPEKAHLVSVPTSVPPTEAASASGRRSLLDIWRMTSSVLHHQLDLFFFPASYSYFPVLNRSRMILTIHDMIPAVHSREIFENRRQERFWNWKHALAVRQAACILTVSEHSKRQVVEGYSYPESRVFVVPEGPAEKFRVLERNDRRKEVLRKYRMDSDDAFLLYVGGISPHKNLRRLVEAFSRLVQQSPSLRLVLAGDYETDSFYSDYPYLKNQVAGLGLQNSVIFTGFVDDEDLVHLYNAATLCVLPSLQEGFGLPAVEAMACGLPVVASRAGSLPEIVGDAGVFFDPYRVSDLVDALFSVLNRPDRREEMRRRGLQRVERFEWDRASKVTLTVFRQLKEQQGGGS